jgi:hypothetical protein
MVTFYTYLWLREDGTPYYVGKGRGDRAFTKNNHRFQPPPNSDLILVQEYPDETSAFVAEQFFISFYGRKDQGTGCLRNLTDGGEGASGTIRRKGWHHTEEAKRRIVLSLLNNKRGVGHKNHVVPHTPAARLKMRSAKLGISHTPEHNRNIGLAGLGNKNFPKIRRNGRWAKEDVPHAEVVCS